MNQHEWRRFAGCQGIEGRVTVGTLETVEIDIENREAVFHSIGEFVLQTLDLLRYRQSACRLIDGQVQGAEDFSFEEE